MILISRHFLLGEIGTHVKFQIDRINGFLYITVLRKGTGNVTLKWIIGNFVSLYKSLFWAV